MTGLAALCLAVALGVALVVLLAVRETGWRRRRIGMLVRPWLVAILILLTIGLAAEVGDGIAALSWTGWIIGSAWLAVACRHMMARIPAMIRRGLGRTYALGGWRCDGRDIAIVFFTSTVERRATGETVASGG